MKLLKIAGIVCIYRQIFRTKHCYLNQEGYIIVRFCMFVTKIKKYTAQIYIKFSLWVGLGLT